MSVPPLNQDGSFPDGPPDFLRPSGEDGPKSGTDGLGDPYQQYGQPDQYPTYPPTGSTPGQPPFPYPTTPQNPYNPPAQPTGGSQPYPPTEHTGYSAQGYPPETYPPAPKPTTWSWAKRVGIFWLVAFIALAVFFAGRSLWPSSRPTTTTSTPPSPTTSSPQIPHTSGPELPIVLEPAPVLQAIDLPEKPTLGEEWNASDGHPANDGMVTTTIITPCGVLVTFLTPRDDTRVESGKAPPEADQSRIVGYEIATGTQLWTVDLQDASGQHDPELYIISPTYTPDCRMIFKTYENEHDEFIRQYVSLMVNLVTGETSSYYSDYLWDCQAVDNDWAACWTMGEVFLLSLSDFARSPENAAPLSYKDRTNEYLRSGGLAVSGYMWTPAGYRDPNSGDIVFGEDTHVGSTYSDSGDSTLVMYVEPLRPGAYRSGLVLRVEGSLFGGVGICQAMLWDPMRDTGLWETPSEFTCGEDLWGRFSFVATQTALLITAGSADADVVNAYALSDGHFIWQQEGWLSIVGESLQFVGDSASGVTNDFATFFTPDLSEHVVRRIYDGADVLTNGNFVSYSTTMVYAKESSPSDNRYSVAAYSLDIANPNTTAQRAWSISLGEDPAWLWTFATGGKMYLVTQYFDTKALTVRPFVS